MRLASEMISDTGKVRSINEDSIYRNESHSIWAVADGMGGHHRGDIASRAVIESLAKYQPTRHSGVTLTHLELLLKTANDQLLNLAAQENSGLIASTCTAITTYKDTLVCTWVGDSRVYRYRDTRLDQLTRDHSYHSIVEDLHNNGKTLDDYTTDLDTLTRGIGAEPNLEIEHCQYNLRPGDRLLLCTDGLYKELSDSELHSHYNNHQDDASLLSTLHNTYLERGARDNLGLILLTAYAE
ncbi:hypothetical protein AB833_15190 [Chromatiales bacterium (ex Bugula neritina AB1)]|nr:hypothetical protein AB833_15190 [Chromatiales bacterium (ex Bugula neritina AB1)]